MADHESWARRLLPTALIDRASVARWYARMWWAHHRAEGIDRVVLGCAVCGRSSKTARSVSARESRSCTWCGSTVRMKAVVHAVAGVLGESQPLPEWNAHPGVRAIGFSEDGRYARGLAAKLDFENSYFHVPPIRDLLEPSSFEGNTYDLVICGEVLEHVDRPVERAVATLFEITRPGGTVVVSFPMREGETVEHFPVLASYSVAETGGGDWRLTGTTPEGEPYENSDLVFHGGPGATLEMRLIGRAAAARMLSDAGFVDVQEHRDEKLDAGLVWEGTPEYVDTDGGRVFGMHSGVWTARRPA